MKGRGRSACLAGLLLEKRDVGGGGGGKKRSHQKGEAFVASFVFCH